MKSNFKILMYLVFITSFLFTSCDEKDDFQDTDDSEEVVIPDPVVIITTGINTGTEANNNEILRLDKVISSEKTTTNLSIIVLDENNNTISNASLKIGEVVVTTDETGYVLLENIELNKEYQVITTEATGYTNSVKTITPSDNGITNISITLIQPTFEEAFNATEGGTVSNDELSIEFPTNAIADQNGDLFDGDVTATVTYYDPNSDSFSATIPGTLVGLDDDDTMQALLSKGMIKVDLTDNSGEELEIFEGKEATITLPAANDDPETIDFWHLNEAKGIWVQTGTATKVGNTYITTVTHFSTYNLDVKAPSINVTFIIKNGDGDTIANQKLTVIATHQSDTYALTVITDNKGEFKIINAPKGADFNLDFTYTHTASQCDDIILSAGIINETTTKELTIDKNLLDATRLITFEGTLNKCEDELFANKLFSINIINGNGIDKINAYTNAEGAYSVTSLLCNYDTTTTYEATINIFNENEIITKNTNFIFDSNIIRNLDVCDSDIIEIDPTIKTNFSDYFILSPEETTGILNLEVLDESSIDIAHILLYDIGGNLVGFFLGNTRIMNVSYLFENSYSFVLQTNKGQFSTEFNKVDN